MPKHETTTGAVNGNVQKTHGHHSGSGGWGGGGSHHDGTSTGGGSGKGTGGNVPPPVTPPSTQPPVITPGSIANPAIWQDTPHPMTGYTGTASEPLANQQLIALLRQRQASQFGNKFTI